MKGNIEMLIISDHPNIVQFIGTMKGNIELLIISDHPNIVQFIGSIKVT